MIKCKIIISIIIINFNGGDYILDCLKSVFKTTNCNFEEIIFKDNLYQNLRFSDSHAINWAKKVDDHISQSSLSFPTEKIIKDNRIEKFKKLNNEKIMAPKDISSIIWATGFRYNYEWIKLNVTDEKGHPVQKRGITKYNGLYFMGLQWMHSSKSAQFVGVAEDAEFIVNDIVSKI